MGRLAPTPDNPGSDDVGPNGALKTVGIELEGAWKNPPGRLHPDRSVVKYLKHLGFPCGERVSPILPADGPAVEEWVRTNYPDIIDVHCGLHIHVFPPNTVGAGLKFERALIYTLSQWRTGDEMLRRRLRGENYFCRPTWTTPKGPSGRNRAVNISHAKKKHGTVEIRILPMFGDVETALQAIRLVLKVVREWQGMTVTGTPASWFPEIEAAKARRRR